MTPIALLAHAWLALQSPEAVTAAAVTAPTAPATVAEAATAPAASAATGPVLLAIPEDELAGEDESTASSKLGSWEAAHGARTGGALAVVLGFYRPDMAGLNRIAEDLNFAGGFGNEAIFVNGIRGYGYIGPYFRIGGLLAEGGASVDDPGADFDRTLDFRFNEGGITLEGVYSAKRWEAYAGGMIGVGNYEITYTQTDLRAGRPGWDALVKQFSGTPDTSTFAKSFSVGYTAVHPWVGAKYKLLPWFALDGRVGYHWGKADRGSWVFSDEPGIGVAGSPSLDASGLTGALEVTFGFFPY